MLKKVIELTNEYIESMPKKERKKYGQFFTSMETARFMARLYNFDEKTGKISMLDAGAGSGILSCAFIERLETIDSIQEIERTCYLADIEEQAQGITEQLKAENALSKGTKFSTR